MATLAKLLFPCLFLLNTTSLKVSHLHPSLEAAPHASLADALQSKSFDLALAWDMGGDWLTEVHEPEVAPDSLASAEAAGVGVAKGNRAQKRKHSTNKAAQTPKKKGNNNGSAQSERKSSSSGKSAVRCEKTQPSQGLPTAGEDVQARSGQARRSGTQGIRFMERFQCWELSWKENGKRRAVTFSVRGYTKPGMRFEEACTAALVAAKAERQKKVAEGIMKRHDAEKHGHYMQRAATKTKNRGSGLTQDAVMKKLQNSSGVSDVGAMRSGVQGIYWDKSSLAWIVRWKEKGKYLTKKFSVAWSMQPGMSVEQACAAALEAAKGFREEKLVHGRKKVRGGMREAETQKKRKSSLPGRTSRSASL